MRKLLLTCWLFLLVACQSESHKTSFDHTILVTPSGDKINTRLVYTPTAQEQGLSGVKDNEFGNDQGMLFFYLNSDMRHFWMPDTYFDLDIFYLDGDLKITDIIRKLPHYIGRLNPDMIPRARGVWSMHVLEMKSSSEIAKKLNLGDALKWEGEKSLNETTDHIRSSLDHRQEHHYFPQQIESEIRQQQ